MPLVPWVAAQGQLSIQQVTLQGESMAPATFFQAVIHNAAGTQSVRIEGRLTSSAGEQVLAFTAEPIELSTGVAVVSPAALVMRSFSYGPGTAARYARLTNRLPEGDFNFCLRAIAVEGEGDDEACEPYRMEELLFLDLVAPWNGDTIDELRPTLSWLLTGTPAAVNDGRARIIVSPQPQGMSAAQAVAAQTPLFIHPETAQRAVAHPPGQPDLLRGQCYAWQAERVVDGRVVDRSDPWSFCVRQRVEPMADKYIRLDRLQPGVVYRAVDRRLFFRYDEPYASTALRCAVIGHDGKRLEPELSNDGIGTLRSSSAGPGANLFELDLSPYGLKPGIHTLEVRDGKGRRYELQFESKP